MFRRFKKLFASVGTVFSLENFQEYWNDLNKREYHQKIETVSGDGDHVSELSTNFLGAFDTDTSQQLFPPKLKIQILNMNSSRRGSCTRCSAVFLRLSMVDIVVGRYNAKTAMKFQRY